MSRVTEATMDRCREAAEQSDLSLREIGIGMGYDENNARQQAWQFLNKTADPRLSMLERFANAIEVRVEDLVRAK